MSYNCLKRKEILERYGLTDYDARLLVRLSNEELDEHLRFMFYLRAEYEKNIKP